MSTSSFLFLHLPLTDLENNLSLSQIYKRRKEVDDIVRYEASQQESFDDLKTDAFFMHVHRSAYQLYYTWPVKGQPSVKDLWAHFAMIRQYIGLIDDEEHRDLKLHQPGKPVGKPACNYEAERVDAAWNKMFGSPLEARLKWEAQAEKKLKSQKNKRNKPDFDETGNDTAARNTPQAGTSGTSSRNRSKGVAKKPTAKKPKKGQGNIPEVATLLPLPATAPPRGGLLPSHGLLPEIAARTLGSLGEPFTIGPNCESMTFDFFMTHQEGWRFTDTAAMHSLLEISDAIKQIDKTEREARECTHSLRFNLLILAIIFDFRTPHCSRRSSDCRT